MVSIEQEELTDMCKRVARTAEVIIRKTLMPSWRLPKNLFFYSSIVSTMKMYREKCYPLGLADERIVDYLLYNIYRSRDAISNRSNFSITWLFTPQCVEKYRAQFLSRGGRSGIRYYIDEWMEENGLTMARLLEVINKPKSHAMAQYVYLPSEEHVKKRWLNTDVGYAMCAANTTGWSPMSDACRACKYPSQCKEMMNKKFPELLRIRQNYG